MLSLVVVLVVAVVLAVVEEEDKGDTVVVGALEQRHGPNRRIVSRVDGWSGSSRIVGWFVGWFVETLSHTGEREHSSCTTCQLGG